MIASITENRVEVLTGSTNIFLYRLKA